MIFAKIDVNIPHHYRLLDVGADSVRVPLGIRAESERRPPTRACESRGRRRWACGRPRSATRATTCSTGSVR